MTPQQVIEHFGSQTKTARALGLAQSTVAGWIVDGEVPEARQYQIEMATRGLLRADRPALREPVDTYSAPVNRKSNSPQEIDRVADGKSFVDQA